ncbi:hypothetical protein BD779DRAFT_1675876 [Infundibulicybe gibba]|nr:hypothetical protein BD779DRAFT_1675876 [Infundibulicybe gibba]
MDAMFLQGAILSGYFYGIVTILFLMCVYLLWQTCSKSGTRQRQHVVLLFYTMGMFALGTLAMISNATKTEENIKADKKDPTNVQSFGILGHTCFVLSNWGADSLLLWRCWVIYRDCSVPKWLFLSALSALPLVSLGILLLAENPESPLETTLIRYGAITLALNVVTTLSIVGRLLVYRRRIVKVLGKSQTLNYSSVVSMLIESAALVVVFYILFLIPSLLSYPISSIVYPSIVQVQIIAPFLIIFRVAQGKAWSAEANRPTAHDTFSQAQSTRIGFASTVIMPESPYVPTTGSGRAVSPVKLDGEIA